MSFFYDLNKRLADLAKKTEQQQIAESKKAEAVAQSPLTQALNESDYSAKKAAAGKDIGKPGKAFAKIAKSAGAKYGSKAAGERVAGAVLNKLRHPTNEGEETCNECGMYESQCGCDHMGEGNAFTGALAKTPKGGKFKVGNKEFTDTSSIEEEGSAPMTAKQKAFAKLAPPADKITFADKIAGAKKEVDEMLGDVAAEAMRKAVMGHEEVEEGYAEMDAWLKQREKEKGTGKFDVKDTGYSKRYTRKLADEPTDDEEVSDKPKKKGRPAGTKRAIGAKVKGTSKLHKSAAIAEVDSSNQAAYIELINLLKDPEAEIGSRTRNRIMQLVKQMVSNLEEKAPPGAKAERMVKHIKAGYAKDGKLTDKEKSIAYATAWKAKKAGKVEEESTDKEDQKAEKAGKKVAKDIEHDEGHKGKDDNRAEKAGKKVTKDIEYDDKKDKEEKVDETTTSGSVATASAAPKAGKGMQFGKGVYESLDKKLETMISEGMDINVNMGNNGDSGETHKSITVTADGADADKLAELLKMAGLGSDYKQVCPSCGSAHCGCEEELDENSPDWPTNTETKDADPELRTYSGGLNGPKSTGQTTVPVIASQLRRQVSMEESVELERTLFKTWKNYKG